MKTILTINGKAVQWFYGKRWFKKIIKNYEQEKLMLIKINKRTYFIRVFYKGKKHGEWNHFEGEIIW